jgi:hypothetical protein
VAYYLPSNSQPNGEPADSDGTEPDASAQMTDLKIFWGPEICRIEYLLHLLDTGRIVDEQTNRTA